MPESLLGSCPAAPGGRRRCQKQVLFCPLAGGSRAQSHLAGADAGSGPFQSFIAHKVLVQQLLSRFCKIRQGNRALTDFMLK